MAMICCPNAALARCLVLFLFLAHAGSALAAGNLAIGQEADGQLEVFRVDTNGTLSHRWRQPVNGAWSSWSELGGSLGPGFAAITGTNGKIQIFGVNQTTRSLECMQQLTTNASNWSDWMDLGGACEPNVAAVEDAGNRIEVFVVDAITHTVKHRRHSATGWSSWQDLGGAVKPDIVASRNADGRVELFGINAADAALMHCFQLQPGTTNWSAWENLGGMVEPGFAAAQNVAGRMEVFAVRPDGVLKRICQISSSSSTQWTAWENFGAGFKPGLAAVVCGAHRVELFAVNAADATLLHRWELFTDGSDKWSAWASMGEKIAMPVVAPNEDGDLEVFGADPTDPNLIHYRRQISSASDWLDWSTLDEPVFNYASRWWQVDEGLPNNVVQAIAQTWDGYLWIGTREGLARFDGVQFSRFDIPAIKDSSITALCCGGDGALWIGTPTGGLLRLKGGQLTSFGKTNGLAGDDVRVIYKDREDVLWIGTATGLSRFQGGMFNNFSTKSGLLSDSVNYLSQDRDGNLWIATARGLNRLRTNGTMDAFTMPSGLPNDSVRGICQDRGGHIWIGSNNGLLWFDWYWQRDFYAYNTKYGLSDPFVSAICDDRDGNLWVGTYSGLNRFHDGRFYNQFDNEGLPFDKVNVLFVDREGDLWVGSQEGLIRLTTKRFFACTRQQGLTHNNVMSVLEDHSGNLWIGTWGGGLNRLKNETVSRVALTAGITNALSEDLILSLCESRDGSLWVGADFDGGLTRWRNGTITHYTWRDGLINAGLRVLREDNDGRLWIGTSRGLCCLQQGKFATNAVTAKLAGAAIRDILEDHAGALWFATANGLRCWRNGAFSAVTAADGLSDDSVTALYEDAENTLWIGTSTGGLNRFRHGHVTAYTTRQGLFSDEIFGILEDDAGCLWMSCSRGVFRVRKNEFDKLDRSELATLASLAFGKNDGMESAQCNGAGKPSAWKGRDGRFWFSTSKGLVSVDPETIKTDSLPPPVLIEAVVADRKQVGPGNSKDRNRIPEPFSIFNAPAQPLRVPPGRGEMEFHYTALSLAAPEKNRFKYKLSGVDADWVDAGTRRVAYYNNLTPDRYEFRVRACNKDGVWNETGAALTVRLAPHVWQTVWFRALLSFVIVGGASGLALYSTRRRMQRKLARLEQQHALEKERARIARDMHDQIGAGLTQIGLLGELARREREKPLLNPQPSTLSQICDTARELAQTLDEIVWTVNPQNDTLNKLGVYLAAYAEEYFQAMPIRCRLDIPPGLPEIPLSAELRHNLFLTVKEALNNIAKHSRATEARLSLTLTDSAVEMTIEDNGSGFSAGAANGGGNGLSNMRQRMAEVGGRFEIFAEPAKGTRLCLHIPLPGMTANTGKK